MLASLLPRPERNLGRNAPITEALIDIRVKLDGPVSLAALKAINGALSSPYPTLKTQTEWSGRFTVSEDAGSTVSSRQGLRGFLLCSADDKEIVQVRRDGFTFSRLWPYDSWDSLKSSAREVWHHYSQSLPDGHVTRLAVRYINTIGLADSRPDLGEWFRMHPVVPSQLGTRNQHFLSLALEHPEDSNYRAVVNQGTTAPLRRKHGSAVLLDLDCWREVSMPFDADDLWTMLDDLRTYKNDLFFGSITPKTLEWLEDGNAGPEQSK